MARRKYSNTAVDTTLSAGISSGDTSLTVASATGYPSSGAFAILIDDGQAAEEVVLIGSRSGTTFTVTTRGFDGSTAQAHSSGATVKLVAIAADLEDAAAHRWDTPAAAGDSDVGATSIHHTLETTASTQAIGDAAAAGASFKAAPGLHKHAMPSGTAVAAAVVGEVGQHRYVRKSADESVSSSTSFQNDDALLIAVAANEVWAFEMWVMVAANGTDGDIKLDVTGPTGSVVMFGLHPQTDTGAALSEATALTGGGLGIDTAVPSNNSPVAKLIKGLIRNGANAGNLQLRWCQATSSVVATRVLTDSYLLAHRLA